MDLTTVIRTVFTDVKHFCPTFPTGWTDVNDAFGCYKSVKTEWKDFPAGWGARRAGGQKVGAEAEEVVVRMGESIEWAGFDPFLTLLNGSFGEVNLRRNGGKRVAVGADNNSPLDPSSTCRPIVSVTPAESPLNDSTDLHTPLRVVIEHMRVDPKKGG